MEYSAVSEHLVPVSTAPVSTSPVSTSPAVPKGHSESGSCEVRMSMEESPEQRTVSSDATVCVCVCMHMCVCAHVCVCIMCVCTRECMCVCTHCNCLHTCTCMHMYAHMCRNTVYALKVVTRIMDITCSSAVCGHTYNVERVLRTHAHGSQCVFAGSNGHCVKQYSTKTIWNILRKQRDYRTNMIG